MTNINNLLKTWQIKKLGEVCKQYFSGTWGEDPGDRGNVFIVRVSDVEDEGVIDYDSLPLRYVENEKIAKYQLRNGDIVIVKSSGSKKKIISGKAAMFIADREKKILASNFVLAIRPDRKSVLPKWLLFCLNSDSAKQFVEKIIGITTYPNLKPQEYLKMQIPLPPIIEQLRIVKKIEELFEKIDQAKKLREEVSAETEELIPAALGEVFDRAEKEEWETSKIGEVVKFNYGKGLNKSERKENGKYNIYGANGILGHTDKYYAEGEAIIIGRKGSAGEVTRVSGRFWPSDVTYYVFGSQQIDIDFLYYVLKKINLRRLARGIKPGINRNEVYNLTIPLPSIAKQKSIVKYLDSLQSQVQRLKQLQSETQKELEELKKSILDRAFKGELV